MLVPVRILFVALLCGLSALTARAQGILTFAQELHDFGSVPEGTVAAHEFKFQNTGNQPIIIANVQASCGCTTPDWTRTPILPGKSGVVKAMYSSAGRPGIFSKTITVTSNAATPTQVLTIKGNVLNREEIRKSLTPAQLAVGPRATVAQPTRRLGRVEVGQQPVVRVAVQNTGKQELVFGSLTSACNCVGYRIVPAPIKPGTSGTLELLYAPRKLGALSDEATLVSNDLHGNLTLTLQAEVVKSLNATSLVKESDVSVPFK